MRTFSFTALTFLAVLGAPIANAAPNDSGYGPGYCTARQPYAGYNSVCNGYGQQCYLGYGNCTSVPGVPGTWNPEGYTPCQNQRGCPRR